MFTIQDCGEEVSSAVLSVLGVVSVVLDVDHQRCSVLCYKEARPVDVAAEIKDKAGLITQLVNKNGFGEEVSIL